MDAYKSLKFFTPFEKIVKEWKSSPKLFFKNPHHFIVGLNKYINNHTDAHKKNDENNISLE